MYLLLKETQLIDPYFLQGNPLLIVQDPINEFNNVTRNTSIMKIKVI